MDIGCCPLAYCILELESGEGVEDGCRRRDGEWRRSEGQCRGSEGVRGVERQGWRTGGGWLGTGEGRVEDGVDDGVYISRGGYTGVMGWAFWMDLWGGEGMTV